MTDHVIAPRIPGQVVGGWNDPHPTPWARQVSAEATTDGATAPPPAARLDAGSPALTNVCRHAGSDRAAVTLRLPGDGLDLEILDAGQSGGPWKPGVGIASMCERAETVGGTCTTAPTLAGGRVTAHLPL